MDSSSSWAGRTVAITGVGRAGQVGHSLAVAFAARGARVVLIDRDASQLRERANELRSAGHDAHPFPCDLTDPAQLAIVASEVAAVATTGISALINAAGGFAMSGPVAESEPEVWHRQIAINLTTAYLATRAFLPLVRSARGAVVYFASASALPAATGARMAAYSAAKSGVLALMRAVAAEEARNGVRANAVAPTAIRTPENEASMGESSYVEMETIVATVLRLCADGGATGEVVPLG